LVDDDSIIAIRSKSNRRLYDKEDAGAINGINLLLLILLQLARLSISMVAYYDMSCLLNGLQRISFFLFS
jgi:hypothetical protein